MTNKPLVITAGLPTATQLSSTDLSDGPSLPLAGGTMSGGIAVNDGSAATPGLWWNSASNRGFFNDTTNSGIGISVGGTQRGYFNSTGINFSASDTEAGLTINTVFQGFGDSTVQAFLARFSASGGSGNFQFGKGRGSRASPAVPNNNDGLGSVLWSGYTTGDYHLIGSYKVGASIVAAVAETATWSTTTAGTRLTFSVCPVGSGTLTEVMRLTNEAGLQMFGANSVIDQNRTHIHRSYTIGTLPTNVTGGAIFCSDLGGGGNMLISDGTNWKRLGINSYEARSLATGAETLNVLTNANYVNYTATLTANVTVTLGTTNAYKGAVFIIRNKGTGAFTFAIVNGGAGAGTLVTFAASTAKEATCVYDGTNWVLMQDSLI